MKWRRRLVMGAVVAGAMAVLLPLALASGNDDHAVADALVGELDRDTAHAKLVADPLGRAHSALERAARMRAAGDEAHARLADGVAREWAETARDLVRAAEAETHAAELHGAALDAGAQMERERAMLEEGIARTGRLRAEVEAAEREAKETNRTAAFDAGAPKPEPPRARRDAGGPSPMTLPRRRPPAGNNGNGPSNGGPR